MSLCCSKPSCCDTSCIHDSEDLFSARLDEGVYGLFDRDPDKFFSTEESHRGVAPPENYQFISRERLIGILNGVAKLPRGMDLLEELKLAVNTSKILFVKFQRDGFDDDTIERCDAYVFRSDHTLFRGNREMLICVKNDPPISQECFVFDGEKIVPHSVEVDNPESYIVYHELAHVVSFLESEIKVVDDWDARKADWSGFLETPRMHLINQALRDKRLSQDDINRAFEGLFENTEDARNLLGFETKNGTIIGEFSLFTARNNFLLPTYLGEARKLTENEKTVLEVIGKEFGIKFQVGGTWSCIAQ